MDRKDLLFAVEEQTSYLEDSVTLLGNLTVELNNELTRWEQMQHNSGITWALNWCKGFNVLLRDMIQISENLSSVVNYGFECENAAQTMEDGGKNLESK